MSISQVKCFVFSAFIAVSLLLPRSALAQASYAAQVRGTVTDPSGAVIQNATVTITNVGTNINTVAKTGFQGPIPSAGTAPGHLRH